MLKNKKEVKLCAAQLSSDSQLLGHLETQGALMTAAVGDIKAWSGHEYYENHPWRRSPYACAWFVCVQI